MAPCFVLQPSTNVFQFLRRHTFSRFIFPSSLMSRHHVQSASTLPSLTLFASPESLPKKSFSKRPTNIRDRFSSLRLSFRFETWSPVHLLMRDCWLFEHYNDIKACNESVVNVDNESCKDGQEEMREEKKGKIQEKSLKSHTEKKRESNKLIGLNRRHSNYFHFVYKLV